MVFGGEVCECGEWLEEEETRFMIVITDWADHRPRTDKLVATSLPTTDHTSFSVPFDSQNIVLDLHNVNNAKT